MKTKTTKLAGAIATTALVGAILMAPAQAAFAKSWSFSEDSVSLGLKGVSPHVQKTSKGDRLWRSDMVPTGTAVTICDSSGNCTQETFSTGSAGPVSDYTIAKASSGWRAYFKSTDTSSQKIMSAPCTTDDCLIKQDQDMSIPEYLFAEVEQFAIKELTSMLQIPQDNSDDGQNALR
jgi:hypothetical protein